MRKQETAESSSRDGRQRRMLRRENSAYCFTLRALRHAAAPSGFPWPVPFFLAGSRKYRRLPPGREDAGGAVREISKCLSIIKVYRFTAGRFSYANLAGRPSVRIISLDFPGHICAKWLTEKKLGRRQTRDASFRDDSFTRRVNGNCRIPICNIKHTTNNLLQSF